MGNSNKGGTLSDSNLTPREAFKIFVFFFLVFAYFGFEHTNNLKRSDVYLEGIVRTKIKVGRDSEGIYFSYRCPDLPLTYHINNNTLRNATIINEPIPEYEIKNDITAIFKDETLVAAIVGGASAWTLKDMVNYISSAGNIAEKKTNINKVTLAIIGGFSGYNFGRYIATKMSPACNDDKVKERVTDKDHMIWLELEKLEWSKDYDPAKNVLEKTRICLTPQILQKRQPLNLLENIESRMNEMEKRITDEAYDLKSQDFDELNSVINDLKTIRTRLDCPAYDGAH